MLVCCHPVDYLGGWDRMATLLTAVIHFLQSLFSFTCYLYYVRYLEPRVGRPLVMAYMSMMIISIISYLFVASLFYMWAWRYPEPEEVARRRRIYGVMVNILFSDIPLFVVGTKLVWLVRFENGVQGFTYCLSCLSLAYSVLRVWTFVMVRIVKARCPDARFPRVVFVGGGGGEDSPDRHRHQHGGKGWGRRHHHHGRHRSGAADEEDTTGSGGFSRSPDGSYIGNLMMHAGEDMMEPVAGGGDYFPGGFSMPSNGLNDSNIHLYAPSGGGGGGLFSPASGGAPGGGSSTWQTPLRRPTGGAGGYSEDGGGGDGYYSLGGGGGGGREACWREPRSGSNSSGAGSGVWRSGTGSSEGSGDDDFMPSFSPHGAPPRRWL